MEQKEKLVELLSPLMLPQNAFLSTTAAEYLIENGVVVLPCRCEECEHQQECKNAQYFGLDGFCSLGERKGGDE